LLALLLLAAATKVSTAFEPDKCDAYVFRTKENLLWHCGKKLPGEVWNRQASMYCDHTQGDDVKLYAWTSNYNDVWCKFMIEIVNKPPGEAEFHPLTPQIGINQSPGPQTRFFAPIVDWGCYTVEGGKTTHSWLVDSRNGKTAHTTTEECPRHWKNWYFNRDKMHPVLRKKKWWGEIPDRSVTPQKNSFGRCIYDNAVKAKVYDPALNVQHAECNPGFVCELKRKDFALCMPDPHEDHECCVSWHNKCKQEGDCCLGSECNEDGYCEVGLPMKYESPPGICEGRTIKTDKHLFNRCFEFGKGQGDCAEGYLCEGNWMYATCVIDHTVKNDCCKYNYNNESPRPGDCCLGWYAHCNVYDEATQRCTSSQCVPGRETGNAENGTTVIDVHNRLCLDTPPLATYNEQLGQCVGAVCGVWGDPHIVTCDDLRYDCQGVGLFTVMKNHMFNIQANFIDMVSVKGSASITNDLVIDYLKDDKPDIPMVQFSFPNFTAVDKNNPIYPSESRKIGNCPVLLYMDETLVDISGVADEGYLYGDASSDMSIKLLEKGNQIMVSHKAGVDGSGKSYYATTKVWVEGAGPFEKWSCMLTYYVCLPREEQEDFKTTTVGLLGIPNGDPRDDWNTKVETTTEGGVTITKGGHTLKLPEGERAEESYEYCTNNWCVEQNNAILTFASGTFFDNYKCSDVEWKDPRCDKYDQYLKNDCKTHSSPPECALDMCGDPPTTPPPIPTPSPTPTDGPDPDPDYGDCANLGAGVSESTGENHFTAPYQNIMSIWASTDVFTIGRDQSVSILVGGDFRCKNAAGFEGRAVFLGDFTVDELGCERMVATGSGSLIHPPDNTVCIEVAGDVSIDTSPNNQKFILNQEGNEEKACHFLFKQDCLLNDEECPQTLTDLEEANVITEGDFSQDTNLDLSNWSEEIVLLKQKAAYWNTLDANGVHEIADNVLTFKVGPDNNPVQIFKIDRIGPDITNVVFNKELQGKTIMIIVRGHGKFKVPPMCYQELDHVHGDEPVCSKYSFPIDLISSTVWVFPTRRRVTMYGSDEMMGSIVIPRGDLLFQSAGHSGRLLVGGNLILDGEVTEMHNYEFDPISHPLPLGEDENLAQICEVVPPPPCNETYKTMTNETACPSKPNGLVKLIKSSASIPEGEPILYSIIIDPPTEQNSAHTVKFKVDNPFSNFTDIFIKHVKKVGKYAMDPVCDAMPFTAGCQRQAPEIEVGCHDYQGVEAFALVNVYFASKKDDLVLELSKNQNVTIDKCCKPPEEYQKNGYGIVEYTFEISCECPDQVASSRKLAPQRRVIEAS